MADELQINDKIRLKYQSDSDSDPTCNRRITLPSPTETVNHSPLVRIDTFYADSTITSALKDLFIDVSIDNVEDDSRRVRVPTHYMSDLQYKESMLTLLNELGNRYPRWKTERFGLLRFYCHKFNISRISSARQYYSRILGAINEEHILMKLLTLEREDSSSQKGIYSRNTIIERILRQLDEIGSCYCSARCAWYLFKGGPHLCFTTLPPRNLNHDFTVVGECFPSSKAKGTGLMEYFSERGIVHCFSRPYVNGMNTEVIEPFSRAVTCINCGKLCRCNCSRCIFRTFKEADGIVSEMEAASRDYLNNLDESTSLVNNKRVLEASVAISHGVKIPNGIIQCFTNPRIENFTTGSNFGAHSQHLFKLTVPRCGVDECFSILSADVDLIVPNISKDSLNAWKNVPKHRAWRRCWWKCHKDLKIEVTQEVEDYVTRTLEQLDAFGNIRYNKSLKIIGVGYIQKRNRTCCYWHYFYISELGLWKCFTSAVEFFLLITSMPLEISLDVKSMHWTVCKCHQGVMHRKSFSTGKHGLLRGYSLALLWLEGVLRNIGLTTEEYSDFENEENDFGRSELLESLCVDNNTNIDECTVSDVLNIAKRRKEILLRENLSHVTRTPSRISPATPGMKKSSAASSSTTSNNIAATFTKLPSVKLEDILSDFQNSKDGLLYTIITQYPELRDYYKRLMNAFQTTKVLLSSHENTASLLFSSIKTDFKGKHNNINEYNPIDGSSFPLHVPGDHKKSDVKKDKRDKNLPPLESISIWNVSYHRNSDSWTCSLDCVPCMICGPRPCERLPNCVSHPNGRELIEHLSKRLNPCAIRYSYHPFYKESPGISKGNGDNCCIVSFYVGKYGYDGAKSLATEFKRRFILELYSDFDDTNEIYHKVLHIIITNELSSLVSTSAFIGKSENEKLSPNSVALSKVNQAEFEMMYKDANEGDANSKYSEGKNGICNGTVKTVDKPRKRRDKSQISSPTSTLDACMSFGDELIGMDGSIKVDSYLSSNPLLTRMCRVLGVCMLSTWVSSSLLRIDFCENHLCWIVNWMDCAGQRRVMYHRLDSFINIKSLISLIGKFDVQWLEALELHNQMTYNEDVIEGAKRFVQVSKAFDIVFSSLYTIQKILYDAMVTSFAQSIRSCMDAQHEFHIIKRLYKIYKHMSPPKKNEVVSRCFTFYDSITFPFGSLHDEGTPPLSDFE